MEKKVAYPVQMVNCEKAVFWLVEYDWVLDVIFNETTIVAVCDVPNPNDYSLEAVNLWLDYHSWKMEQIKDFKNRVGAV